LRISGDIVVEAGALLLGALIDAQVIEILELSISPIAGDGGFIDLDALLAKFEITEDEVVDETRLLKCRYNRYSTDS
jgi:riboflavin biosynthesis pyrimidine reductase